MTLGKVADSLETRVGESVAPVLRRVTAPGVVLVPGLEQACFARLTLGVLEQTDKG